MDISPTADERKSRRTWRSFSDEFKARAVRVVVDEGKTLAAASRELGLAKPLLRAWVDQARAESRQGLTMAERTIVERAVVLFGRPRVIAK
jgi:transposase